MTVSLAAATKSAEANATTALLNSGFIKIYSGSVPATADTALSGNTLLSTLTLNATAFGAASSGVSTANAITSDTNAANTGTASFCRITKSDGTVVMQGSVTATGAGGDLTIASTSIVATETVSCTSLTYTRS